MYTICIFPRRFSFSAREAMTCSESPKIIRLDQLALCL